VGAALRGKGVEHAINNALLSLLFAVLGFALLFAGYKLFDIWTPADLSQKIFEEGNVAAAIMLGAFVIGLAIVVAAAIS
jgi:uncharacterized membrane protein YjfL (UPF0719 family)